MVAAVAHAARSRTCALVMIASIAAAPLFAQQIQPGAAARREIRGVVTDSTSRPSLA